jgi:hypothetical protein
MIAIGEPPAPADTLTMFGIRFTVAPQNRQAASARPEPPPQWRGYSPVCLVQPAEGAMPMNDDVLDHAIGGIFLLRSSLKFWNGNTAIENLSGGGSCGGANKLELAADECTRGRIVTLAANRKPRRWMARMSPCHLPVSPIQIDAAVRGL